MGIIREMVYDRDDPRFRIQPYQQVASSCTGALITSLFMTPLDVVKTRLQVQQKALLSNKCFLYCNGLMDHLCPCGPEVPQFQKTVHFNGTIDAIVKISRTEGVRSLWSGLSPTLVLAVPATVIYFVAYEQLRIKYKDIYLVNFSAANAIDKVNNSIPFYVPLLAGCSARVISVSIVNPLELVRTKMQSQKLSYAEMHRGLKSLISIEGLSGLWRGLATTLCRDVPFSGIYWSCYETLKKTFNMSTPTFGFSFIGGAISGSIAAFLTTPFDVIKTHQQIEFGNKFIYAASPNQSIPSDSTIQTFKKIYTIHGVKGLYAGIIPRLAKVAPACAIMISSFEYGKSFFYTYNVRKYNQAMSIEAQKSELD